MLRFLIEDAKRPLVHTLFKQTTEDRFDSIPAATSTNNCIT